MARTACSFRAVPRRAARDQHAVRRLAAQRLLPGEVTTSSFGSRAAGQKWRRWHRRWSGRGDRRRSSRHSHPHPRGRAVPGEHDVARRVDFREIRQLAIGAVTALASFSFNCLAMSVTQPSPNDSQAKTVTGRAPAATTTPFPPRRYRRPHDADAVIGGNLEHLAGEIDGALELRLADLRSVRASKDGVGEDLQAPAGRLAQGPEEKCG